MAATWRWPSGIASTPRRWACSRPWQQKRKENPNVDLLVGAVNVWAFGMEAVKLCREMQSLGIRRILWSAGGKAEQLEQLNAMDGVLTSRYDIYQDCMDPANFPKLRHRHADWTSAGWPKDVMIDAKGDWIRGWRVDGREGEPYYCGVLCDRLAPGLRPAPHCRRVEDQALSLPVHRHDHGIPLAGMLRARPSADPLRKQAVENGAARRREPRVQAGHRLRDRTRSVGALSALLRGHAQPGALPRAGRRTPHGASSTTCPSRWPSSRPGITIACRCGNWCTTIARWRNGTGATTTTSCPRCGTAATCGTPSTARRRCSCSTRKVWEQNRDRFVKSYQTATPVARATGYSEMLSHAWLTADHSVQQTRFANGVVVTVNFGDQAYRMADGTSLGPMSHHIEKRRPRQVMTCLERLCQWSPLPTNPRCPERAGVSVYCVSGRTTAA